MDEYFLQYIWQTQRFDHHQPTLVDGNTLTVFNPGYHNHDSGPDFKEARLKIGHITWSGAVEVHFRASDWNRHGHDNDPSYNNVILHVVWTKDTDIRIHGEPVPTLELRNLVTQELTSAYGSYINRPETIRCSGWLRQLDPIYLHAMLDRALADRLGQKCARVLHQLRVNKGDWEQTVYALIAGGFGFKINEPSFSRLADTLPYQLIRKQENIHQVLSLVLGMAGFLLHPVDDYQRMLQDEFRFLKGKYSLDPVLKPHHWQKGRMRPGNFPVIRLVQFASMMTGKQNLLDHLLNVHSKEDATAFFRAETNSYWKQHYDFGKVSKRANVIGDDSVNVLTINSVVPVLAAYSRYHDDRRLTEQAENLLRDLPSEDNRVTRKWLEHGVSPEHAGDSQALLFQYEHFCKMRKCLKCPIGSQIINKRLG